MFLALLLACTQSPVAAPDKLALLIGIQEYAPGTPAGFARLSGCVADVRSVREILIERFGFAPGDILVLENEAATHEGIVRAWQEWLIRRAGPNTEVVTWFSGHGSQVPDQSGRAGAELGGRDQTVLAWDSRARGEDGAYDVTDDELYSLRYQLAQKTQRLFAVTDACHSASSLRGIPKGAEPRARAADAGKKPLDRARLLPFWPAVEAEWIEDGDARRAAAPAYVHVAACSESQQALEYEWTDEDGRTRSHGALTLFLTEVLREVPPGRTYRQVADEATARLTRSVAGQTPCYEGALERQLFDARYQAVPPGFLTRLQADGKLAVQAGTLVGLAKGSELRLEHGLSGALVGRARVEEVWATRALATWIALPATEPPAALRAFEEYRAAEQRGFALHVAERALAAGLPADPRVTLLAEPRPDAYLLQRESPGRRLVLFAPGGIPIWRSDPGREPSAAALGAALEAQWREEQRQRALESLTQGTLPLLARMREPTQAELEGQAFAGVYASIQPAGLARPAAGAARGAGEVHEVTGCADPRSELRLVVLEVENTSPCDLYLNVISVMEDRERHVVCPGPNEGDVLLPKGATRKVMINACASASWPLERPVRDRYLVVGTRERADFRAFERENRTRGAEEKLRLPEILQVGLDSQLTRGAGRARVDTEMYGLATVDLLVRAPVGR